MWEQIKQMQLQLVGSNATWTKYSYDFYPICFT